MARAPKAGTPNVPAVSKVKLPANWDAELAKYAKQGSTMEASVAQGQFLSTRSGVLQYGGAPIHGNKLDVVILDAVMENCYYEGKFDPDEPRAPVCFAFGRVEDEMKPHEKSVKPQNETCKGCPHNEFGSADTGRGKSCKNIRRVALITADCLKDAKTTQDAEIAFLKVPVTSIKPWATYVRSLEVGSNRPVWGVISELSVVPDPKTQFKVLFSNKAVLTNKQLEAVFPRVKAIEADIMFPYTYTEPEEKPKAAKGKAVKKKF